MATRRHLMTPIAGRGIRTFEKFQSRGMESMSENGELTLKMYEVARNRLNAVDQWAHNFVNLYFAFFLRGAYCCGRLRRHDRQK
jgi:hypothetical protein